MMIRFFKSQYRLSIVVLKCEKQTQYLFYELLTVFEYYLNNVVSLF